MSMSTTIGDDAVLVVVTTMCSFLSIVLLSRKIRSIREGARVLQSEFVVREEAQAGEEREFWMLYIVL